MGEMAEERIDKILNELVNLELFIEQIGTDGHDEEILPLVKQAFKAISEAKKILR